MGRVLDLDPEPKQLIGSIYLRSGSYRFTERRFRHAQGRCDLSKARSASSVTCITISRNIHRYLVPISAKGSADRRRSQSIKTIRRSEVIPVRYLTSVRMHRYRLAILDALVGTTNDFEAMAEACIANHDEIVRYGSSEMQAASRALLYALAAETSVASRR